MPREPMKIAPKVETLSVLSADGKVDHDLEPEISDTDLRKLYKTMLASRKLDERCLMLQRQGRMGTYGPSKGQEAASLGVAYALKAEDWFVPTFREPAGLLWRGWPMSTWMKWWGGHEAGNVVPEGVNDLPICVPIASQCQYGMGIAWAMKLRGAGHIAAVFCGDGGTSEGDFHEAMNFAGVYNLPMVMIVQNNHWAISIPRSGQTRSQSIAQKAIAYGFDGIQIDGNDLLGVVYAMREAVEKARTGGGPTLIEAVTYRLMMHTTADDPKKYRKEEEVQQWEPRDPLPRLKGYLQHKKLLDEKVEKVIEEEVTRELDEATREYESFRSDPLAMFDHMYAERTPELERQRAELAAHLDKQKKTEPTARDLSRV